MKEGDEVTVIAFDIHPQASIFDHLFNNAVTQRIDRAIGAVVVDGVILMTAILANGSAWAGVAGGSGCLGGS